MYSGNMFYPNMKSSYFVLACVVFAWAPAAQCANAKQCCPVGQVIVRGGCSDTLGQVTPPALNCSLGRWILRDAYVVGDKLYSADATNFVFVEDPEQYCLGVSHRNFSVPSTGLTSSALICFSPMKGPDYQTTGVLTLVSVIFLFLTLVVYLYLPQMRDLQGLCYISLCISMGLGYLFLGLMQLNPGFTGEDCTATGFTIYFWLMATFFWMNIISINTFRSIVDPSYLKKTEKQQFVYYNCYGWGAAFAFLIIALISNSVEGQHLKPGFSSTNCWIQGVAETWLFFYGPVAVLVACNIVLCGLCSYLLWQQNRKYEVSKLNNLRHKFLLALKLFLVMGLSWIFEIASFAHGKSTTLWAITDAFNCLQGLVIFILLVVLRRRAIRGLAEHNFLPSITQPLADKLSPHDEDNEQILSSDDTVEVRLN